MCFYFGCLVIGCLLLAFNFSVLKFVGSAICYFGLGFFFGCGFVCLIPTYFGFCCFGRFGYLGWCSAPLWCVLG